MTQDEAKQIIDAAQAHDPAMYTIICLALSTGLRRNEIAGLRAGKVLLDQNLIIVPADQAKSRKDESVSLPEAIKSQLRTIIHSKSAQDLVFPSARTGGPLKSISPRFRKVVNTTGLNNGVDDPREKIVFHTLRHTYISWLVMMGTDIRTVQGMARHRSISMTMRYAHLAPSNLSHAANQLPVFGLDETGP